jgi:hypothetical protein
MAAAGYQPKLMVLTCGFLIGASTLLVGTQYEHSLLIRNFVFLLGNALAWGNALSFSQISLAD